mmetsp:Transcript_9754/g.22598  ORF Transcript_9754/g.22598 Transcript_9754/m.22598 type:complete len:239 (-) Transcript_9754:281-997(-)
MEIARKKEKPSTMRRADHLSVANWFPARYPIMATQKPLTSPRGCGKVSAKLKSSFSSTETIHIRTAVKQNIPIMVPHTVAVKGRKMSKSLFGPKSLDSTAVVISFMLLTSKGVVKATRFLLSSVSQKSPRHTSTLPSKISYGHAPYGFVEPDIAAACAEMLAEVKATRLAPVFCKILTTGLDIQPPPQFAATKHAGCASTGSPQQLPQLCFAPSSRAACSAAAFSTTSLPSMNITLMV